MLRALVYTLFSVIVLIGFTAVVLDTRYGGGDLFPDRSSEPKLSSDALEKIIDLPFPPGNIAVSEKGQVFFTFHPEGFPEFNLAEIKDGKAIPLQFTSEDNITFKTVLSMRIDQQNRLWVLDYGDHGQETPQIAAIDLYTRKVVHHYEFDSELAGLGSHLNDFQVTPDGKTIFIADASIMGLDPAIIAYDIESKSARRLLDDHQSVEPDDFVPVVEGQKMLMFGVFAIRPGVDSIALDRNAEWLYFAPVTDLHMHRIRVSDLLNTELPPETLEERVEQFAEKTMSDGITTDNIGNIYISDLEHSAITMLSPKGELSTLYKDQKLRWPDGFSFGPDNWLYVTSSALQDVILKPDAYIKEKGPYQIYRLKLEHSAPAGH